MSGKIGQYSLRLERTEIVITRNYICREWGIIAEGFCILHVGDVKGKEGVYNLSR